MSQRAFCLATVWTANAAFAVRTKHIVPIAPPPALPLAELQRQCPLEKAGDPDHPFVLKHRTGPPSAESSCCEDGDVIYNCDSFDFGLGDEVYWKNSDEDIPKGAVGIVRKLEPPEATVKFGRTPYVFDVDTLVLVNPRAPDAEKKDRWLCGCPCKEVEQHMDIVRYSVEQKASGKHIRVWADLESKPSETADKGHVLFLYPASDHNNAFAFHDQLCDRIACWQKRGFLVSLRTVGNLTAAHQALDRFANRGLHHVVLGGHGTPTGLKWGATSKDRLTVEEYHTKQFLVKLREKLSITGSLTLDACETAKEAAQGINFFEYVASKLPGRRIVGATVPLKEGMWKQGPDANCLTGETVVFEDAGEVKMRVQKRGKPNCKEMSAAEIQASAKAGGICLSRCGTTCWMASIELRHSGMYGNVAVTLSREPVQEMGPNPCNYGWKTVCRMGVST